MIRIGATFRALAGSLFRVSEPRSDRAGMRGELDFADRTEEKEGGETQEGEEEKKREDGRARKVDAMMPSLFPSRLGTHPQDPAKRFNPFGQLSA